MKKQNMNISLVLIISTVFLALQMISCQPPSKNMPTIITKIKQTTLTLVPTLKTPTMTQTLVMPVVTKVLTSMPALPVNDARKRVNQLMATNNNCQLPCWWGITPGKTLWQDAAKILAPVSILYIFSDSKRNISRIYANVQAPTDEHGDSLFQNYVVEGGVVKWVDVYNFDFAPFTYFKKFIHQYGVPDQIYIRGYQDTGFELALFYPTKGIFAVYNQTHDEISKNIKTCFESDKSPFLYLWTPNQPMSFDQAMSTFHIQVEDTPAYRPIEETINNLNEFKNSLIDLKSPSCIETPADLWPTQGVSEQVAP